MTRKDSIVDSILSRCFSPLSRQPMNPGSEAHFLVQLVGVFVSLCFFVLRGICEAAQTAFQKTKRKIKSCIHDNPLIWSSHCGFNVCSGLDQPAYHKRWYQERHPLAPLTRSSNIIYIFQHAASIPRRPDSQIARISKIEVLLNHRSALDPRIANTARHVYHHFRP